MDITNYINSIAAVSTLAASRLSAYGQDIRVGYNRGNIGESFRGSIDDYILIDLNASRTLYFFNSLGQLVPGDVRLTIMHELAHIYLPGNDPAHNPTEATMNGADFDFRGPVVDEQNAIAQNAGLSDQIQISYYAAFPSADLLFSFFTANFSYSHGNTIDTTRLGTFANDNIDHSNNTKLLTDLLFGLGGDDSLNGGKGSDYLYGGEDDDTFIGSDSDDLFHGGGTRKSDGTALGLEDDGIDTADYSAAAASEFIKVTTDVTANTFHSGAIDAAHRALIQQTGTGKGTATIISVEKVEGTAGVDTFEVTQLVAAQLAGSDGKGGLAEVDLAGNDKPSREGDLIDATRMTQKLVIDLDPANGFIQVEGDAETKVKVLNAERAWGGENDDTIKGNDEANELKGGAGNDTLIGGDGDDIFYGGAGDDQIWGGALNAASSPSDGIDEVRYGDSVVIKFTATSGAEPQRLRNGYAAFHRADYRIGGG
jgi:Ca2+-binding RTX toxin-like protein